MAMPQTHPQAAKNLGNSGTDDTDQRRLDNLRLNGCERVRNYGIVFWRCVAGAPGFPAGISSALSHCLSCCLAAVQAAAGRARSSAGTGLCEACPVPGSAEHLHMAF